MESSDLTTILLGQFRAIGRQSKPWKPALLAATGTVSPRINKQTCLINNLWTIRLITKHWSKCGMKMEHWSWGVVIHVLIYFDFVRIIFQDCLVATPKKKSQSTNCASCKPEATNETHSVVTSQTQLPLFSHMRSQIWRPSARFPQDEKIPRQPAVKYLL